MSYDNDLGKCEIESMVLDQLLDAFCATTGRTATEEWDDDRQKVQGSPDHIIGLDGKAFGIELTWIRNAGDAWAYVAEVYRLASQKNESYTRRGIFQFPIALIAYSYAPPLFDLRDLLTDSVVQADFDELGFAEVWAADFSDAYYSPGHLLRQPDLFCFKPNSLFGFHRIGKHDRKPFG